MKLDDQMHEYMRERGPVNYYLRRRYGCVWRNRPSSRLLSWPRRMLFRWRSR
jgi:hypothetical protein